jgi:hypothetical protein
MKSVTLLALLFVIAVQAKKLGQPIQQANALNSSLVDVLLDAPPRYMWGWGEGTAGYCGATSFQTNGIFWGEWVSSEFVRTADGGSELLISVNDEKAAKNLKFNYDSWDYNQDDPQGTNFVAWLRSHVDQGHISAVGLYERVPEGDADYDHIVPVIGYQYDASSHATTGIYYNDLWSQATRMLSIPSLITTRSNCQQDDEPEQPYEYCLPKTVDYGIAFLGNVDTNGETYRMTLTIPNWTEPDYGKEDKVNAKPVLFTISATVAGLQSGTSYTVYRFDSYKTLPSSKFASGPYTKKFTFTATSGEYDLNNFDSFMSNSTIFYRAVKS